MSPCARFFQARTRFARVFPHTVLLRAILPRCEGSFRRARLSRWATFRSVAISLIHRWQGLCKIALFALRTGFWSVAVTPGRWGAGLSKISLWARWSKISLGWARFAFWAGFRVWLFSVSFWWARWAFWVTFSLTAGFYRFLWFFAVFYFVCVAGFACWGSYIIVTSKWGYVCYLTCNFRRWRFWVGFAFSKCRVCWASSSCVTGRWRNPIC